MIVALFPFRYPMNTETLILGGIDTKNMHMIGTYFPLDNFYALPFAQLS